jgi:hypothetical protein
MTISSVKQEVVLNAVEVCKFIIGSISDYRENKKLKDLSLINKLNNINYLCLFIDLPQVQL